MAVVTAVSLGGLALGGLAPAAVAEPLPGPSTATGGQSVAVPLAQAGSFIGWGDPDIGPVDAPASLAGVALREVSFTYQTTIALTGAGKVTAWGVDGKTNIIPPAVAAAEVVDIATSSLQAGAVTSDGKVAVWGASSSSQGDPTDVPAGLSGVRQLAIAHTSAFALKDDGTVVGWGRKGDQGADTGVLDIPDGLQATAITASQFNAYALTTDGTVAGWGLWGASLEEQSQLPTETQTPGNVIAVAAVSRGGVALLADGTLRSWGYYGGGALPDLDGKRAVAIAGSPKDAYAVLDEDGGIHFGGFMPDADAYTPPAAAVGAPIAHLSIGDERVGVIATDLARGAAPTVTGTARVGSTLTATPGTFSNTPEQITNEWLLDGDPITTATGPTLPVSSTMIGKRITYRSTATKTGHTPSIATSTATPLITAAAPVAVAKVASTTTVGKTKVAKKAAKVTVTGQVKATKPTTGTATITIAKGKKVIITKTVPVAANGTLTLTVKKFNKTAIKKTKAKNKKTGYRGKYKITITYNGNTSVKPSTATGTFKAK